MFGRCLETCGCVAEVVVVVETCKVVTPPHWALVTFVKRPSKLTAITPRNGDTRGWQVRVQVTRHLLARLETEVTGAFKADVDADRRRRTQLYKQVKYSTSLSVPQCFYVTSCDARTHDKAFH